MGATTTTIDEFLNISGLLNTAVPEVEIQQVISFVEAFGATSVGAEFLSALTLRCILLAT